MKNPKQRAPKRSAKASQASRTTTRQAALKDNSRGLGAQIVTSKLEPHEIPALNLDLEDGGEIYDIPDSILGDDVIVGTPVVVPVVPVQAKPIPSRS